MVAGLTIAPMRTVSRSTLTRFLCSTWDMLQCMQEQDVVHVEHRLPLQQAVAQPVRQQPAPPLAVRRQLLTVPVASLTEPINIAAREAVVCLDHFVHSNEAAAGSEPVVPSAMAVAADGKIG